MYKHIKILIFALTLSTVLSVSCTDSSSKKDAKTAVEHTEDIEWQSLKAGLEKAKIEKKPALIYFYTDWCVYCKKMDKEVFGDPEVKKYLAANFINIRVNPEKEKSKIKIMGKNVSAMELLSYMGGRGFPSTAFWDRHQKPVTNFPGFVEKKVFLPLVKYMSSECYSQNVKLDDYINGRKDCSVN